jgi:DNA-binding transcriptional LysR family regulator
LNVHGPRANLHAVFDWNDLRYLLAISRAGTLAGAARELGVEHTTVGRRLTALEQALGARLFTRGPDGLVATREAEDVLPLAREIADRIDSIERRLARGDDTIEGIVKLTTSEALSGYFVKRLTALRTKHPGLVVEILSGNRAYDLMRGEADLAVRIRETTEPDLITKKLLNVGWSMYASASYVERKGMPKSPEELSGHDIVAFDATMSAIPGSVWLEQHAKGANIVLRANSIISAHNAAIVGLGLTVLPCFLGDDEPSLARVTDRVLGTRDVFLVVHPDLAKVGRVRAVMDFVTSTFEAEAALWKGETRRAGVVSVKS